MRCPDDCTGEMQVVPLQAMPLWVGIAFAALGLALLALGVRDGWRALRYRAARPVPIRDLNGQRKPVVVTGVARRADAVLEAPLTGRECLAYGWRVTEHRTQRGLDGSIGTWGQSGGGRRDAVPFLVDDGTGTLLVDPEGATLRLAEDLVDDPIADPSAREEPGLRELGDDLMGVQTHDRQYFESRLEDGETVTVRGRVGTGTDSLDATRVGVTIGGRGTFVEEGTPAAAAGRALRRAVVSAVAGAFILGVTTVFSFVPGI